MSDIETIVIGAGVVGLATARGLALSGREVMVLERHGLIGSETSARNSEVIHAGIYYPKDSLKARCCVKGKASLYAYCDAHGVDYQRMGKLIVATDDAQRDDLDRLGRQASANGVNDIVAVTKTEAEALEPNLSCVGALLSPSTGIVDSHGFMLALQGDLETQGGQVVLNTPVTAVREASGGGFVVSVAGDEANTEDYSVTCRELIVCAGHGAPDLVSGITGTNPPRSYFAKGNYFKLTQKAPFSRLVYPVPEPGGRGVHITLDLQGQARFGPDVEWVDSVDYSVDPSRGDLFYAAIRRYWPDLPEGALVADYCGIRPKMFPAGTPDVDFRIDGLAAHGKAGLVALYGIESPGLTGALEIADVVLERLA